MPLLALRRGGRAVECTGLENRRRLITYPGFESLPLRHFKSTPTPNLLTNQLILPKLNPAGMRTKFDKLRQQFKTSAPARSPKGRFRPKAKAVNPCPTACQEPPTSKMSLNIHFPPQTLLPIANCQNNVNTVLFR